MIGDLNEEKWHLLSLVFTVDTTLDMQYNRHHALRGCVSYRLIIYLSLPSSLLDTKMSTYLCYYTNNMNTLSKLED